jgi:rRNA small subunit pseudouridine methyltransferase Nep1
MPLIIVLVECGLELIPKQIRTHPAVKKNLSSSIYSSQLLDNALHFSAMKNLKNKEKRGRPDISHLCLLNALGSVLNKSGNLELYLHTVNNKIFKFNPEIRIARNYNRFKGLIAKLIIDGKIEVGGKMLIAPVSENLEELIKSFNSSKIDLFSREGKNLENDESISSLNLSENYLAIIGGFQKSTFADEILKLSNRIMSISQYSLDAWVVINKVINMYELSHNIN